ncbi:MAG: hypothetical protein ACPGUD_04605 [Parashewanella sp.]
MSVPFSPAQTSLLNESFRSLSLECSTISCSQATLLLNQLYALADNDEMPVSEQIAHLTDALNNPNFTEHLEYNCHADLSWEVGRRYSDQAIDLITEWNEFQCMGADESVYTSRTADYLSACQHLDNALIFYEKAQKKYISKQSQKACEYEIRKVNKLRQSLETNMSESTPQRKGATLTRVDSQTGQKVIVDDVCDQTYLITETLELSTGSSLSTVMLRRFQEQIRELKICRQNKLYAHGKKALEQLLSLNGYSSTSDILDAANDLWDISAKIDEYFLLLNPKKAKKDSNKNLKIGFAITCLDLARVLYFDPESDESDIADCDKLKKDFEKRLEKLVVGLEVSGEVCRSNYTDEAKIGCKAEIGGWQEPTQDSRHALVCPEQAVSYEEIEAQLQQSFDETSRRFSFERPMIGDETFEQSYQDEAEENKEFVRPFVWPSRLKTRLKRALEAHSDHLMKAKKGIETYITPKTELIVSIGLSKTTLANSQRDVAVLPSPSPSLSTSELNTSERRFANARTRHGDKHMPTRTIRAARNKARDKITEQLQQEQMVH